MEANSIFEQQNNFLCDSEILENTDQQNLTISKPEDISNEKSLLIFSRRRLRVAITIITQTFTPAVLKIYYIYLKNQQLLSTVRHHFFPSVIAFIVNSISQSLACVQSRITLKPSDAKAITPSPGELTGQNDDISNVSPERSVECQVLASPTIEQHIADVIFIHGLHGGIDRTWKQGQWRNDGNDLVRQKPIRRNSSEMIYIPPRRQSLKRAMSEIYQKIPYKVAKKSEESSIDSTSGDENDINENQIPKEDQRDYSKCWPQDWLPLDCPGVRVIALNYTTDILWCPIWKKKRIRTDMVERSDEMIEELQRLGVGKKPIIWVGHSKGGLFIKQIILNCWEKLYTDPIYHDIFHNSKAIMFYSVPHKGSYLADVTIPFLRRSVEVIEIQRNCDFVLNLHRRFLNLCQERKFNAEIFSFIETSFTFMAFVYLKIVAYESADPDIGFKCGVPLDHREICKPAGRDCLLYLELVRMIKKHVFNNM